MEKRWDEMRSTSYSGNALSAENKLHEFRPQTIFCYFCWKPLIFPETLQNIVQFQNIVGTNF